MNARAFVLYEVFPQLDALGIDGVGRLLGAFANIEEEAERVAQSAVEAYGRLSGEGDMGDFADSALDQGIDYYRTLSALEQSVANLLAVGLYHLFEQHEAHLRHILTSEDRGCVDFRQLASWPQVNELRLLANAVKHADGRSAEALRQIRPDYFVAPIIRGSPLGNLRQKAPVALRNPIGGTDFFVRREDLEGYRDSLRALWEEALPYL